MNDKAQRLRLVEKTLDKTGDAGGAGTVDPPGGGGDDGGMEQILKRLDRLDAFAEKANDRLTSIGEDIATLKERASQYATKTDLSEAKSELSRETSGLRLEMTGRLGELSTDLQKAGSTVKGWMLVAITPLLLAILGLYFKPTPQPIIVPTQAAAPAWQSAPIVEQAPQTRPPAPAASRP
jgi:hypothetical protein